MKRIAVAVGLALTIAATLLAPGVAAYELKNVLVSSFKAPGARGTVALIEQGNGTLRLAFALVGLAQSQPYLLRFSTSGCGSGGPAGILTSYSFSSDARGTAFSNTTFDDEAAQQARSIRLVHDSAQVECRRLADFDSDGDVEGNFLTIFDGPSAQGIVNVRRTNDPDVDRLIVTFTNLANLGAQHTLRASTKPCGAAHHHPADTIRGWSWGVTNTGLLSRSSKITHDPDFEHWASARLLVNNEQVACAKTHHAYVP